MNARLVKQERRYSLSTKRGWLASVEAPERKKPEAHTRAQIAKLSEDALLEYRERQAVWNANIGPIHTPQYRRAHEDLWNILDTNREDGDQPRLPAAIDAYPGLGKSTIANAFGRDYHRRQIQLYGKLTEEGHERVPVVRIQLTDQTTRRDLNATFCRFFNLPGCERATANHLGNKAADAVISCDSTLIIVDDVHFLDIRRTNGRAVANHFKSLANTFPATFLYVGVGLAERGLLDDGLGPEQLELAQNGRRWTLLNVEPFSIKSEAGRETWRALLLAIEKSIVLAESYRGMIADDLSDALYARSTGHFASLMSLVKRGCTQAVKTGAECLTEDVLAQVKNDPAAERERVELEAAIAAGRLSSRPRPPRTRRATSRKPTGAAR
jgi:hypothetical protein